jgi:hypothetical protein
MAIGRDGTRHLIGTAVLSCIAAIVFICVISLESSRVDPRSEQLLQGGIGGGYAGGAQTLDISSLEQEASSALPQVSGARLFQPARLQSLADAGEGDTNLATQQQQQQQQQQQDAEFQAPGSGDTALSAVSGTLEGTNDVVSLKPINSAAAAATQMLSSPTSLSGMPWGITSTATVAGPGYIQPSEQPMPIADCTGVGCVQRVPGSPASPGVLATQEHVYTDMDASLPQFVAQQTVRRHNTFAAKCANMQASA